MASDDRNDKSNDHIKQDSPSGAGHGDDLEKHSLGHHEEQLLFFNYHEISTDDYKPVSASKGSALIITHFPNPYHTSSNTRIVRIPRDFTNSIDDDIPIFSNVLPGYEQLALLEPGLNPNPNDPIKKFIIRGSFKGQFFGFSSVSPLSNYLSPIEFGSIVNKVNFMIQDALQVYKISSLLWLFFDNLFLTIPSMLRLNYLRIWDKGKFQKLEKYIDELNDTGICGQKNIKLISPRLSGFLSLDFEIPTPTLEG